LLRQKAAVLNLRGRCRVRLVSEPQIGIREVVAGARGSHGGVLEREARSANRDPRTLVVAHWLAEAKRVNDVDARENGLVDRRADKVDHRLQQDVEPFLERHESRASVAPRHSRIDHADGLVHKRAASEPSEVEELPSAAYELKSYLTLLAGW
jgi:hypothetical protein